MERGGALRSAMRWVSARRRGRSPRRRSNTFRARPLVWPLEERALPSGPTTGAITGTVFDDRDGNGTRDPGEPGLEGWRVYLDLSHDGQLDAGDPSTVTDLNGNFTFSGLAPGVYTVRERILAGWQETLPAGSDPAGVNVTVTAGGTASGSVFGDEQTTSPPPEAFQFTLNDPKHEFDAYPLMMTDLQAAGQILSGLLEGFGTIDVEVVADDQIPRSNGGVNVVVPLGTQSGTPLYELGTIAESKTGVDPNGATPDVEIQINAADYLPTAWFDPSGAARTGTVPSDKIDFISIALHEMLHGLGFESYRIIDGPKYGQFPADYRNTFDIQTAFGTGGDPNVVYFSGPHAVAAYGGPVPLTSVGTNSPITSENFNHLGNPAGMPGADLIPDLMNGVVFNYGTKYAVGGLDLAILSDLGWTVNPQVVGNITGTVFDDLKGDGVRTADDPGLGGRTVYIDHNGNGVFDPGEPSVTTDANGDYRFTDLPPGTYTIREVDPPGWNATSPEGLSYTVTVGAGQTATGDDFGNAPGVPNPPGAPQLSAQSDTGVSSSDGLTRDNGSSLAPLIFSVAGVVPADSYVQLYDVTGGGTPVPLGSPVQAVGGVATITLADSPLADGRHLIAATAATTLTSTPSALSPSTAVTIQTSLHVVATTPADGGVITALPGGQVVIQLSHPLASLTSGGPAITAANPFAVTLIPRGPDGVFSAPSGLDSGDLPLHVNTLYQVNPDGTSQITLTPTVPLGTDVYAISVGGNFTDLAGNPLTDAQGHAGPVYTTFMLRPITSADSLRVSGVSTANGTQPIANNAIPQPDTIAITFNKPLDSLTVNGSTVQLLAKQGSTYTAVASAVAYSPGTRSIMLIPEALLRPGTVYLIAVAGSVSDDQGFPNPGYALGTTFYDTFSVTSSPAGPGQPPLEVVRGPNALPQTLPASGVIWKTPVGYASVTFTEPVSLASLGRFSAMLIPRSGGLDTNAFDAADVPLNARIAFNPNMNELIIVPTVPVGDDLYLYSLSSMNSAKPDGTPNPGDPLTDPGGLPVYATFLLRTSPQAGAAVPASAVVAVDGGTTEARAPAMARPEPEFVVVRRERPAQALPARHA